MIQDRLSSVVDLALLPVRSRPAGPETQDDGYFPSGESVLRRVQGERTVGLLYGQRALIIGALDPRNYVGTAEHSRYRDAPFKRLAATGKMFERIFFGTRAEADKVLAVVAGMHSRVEGGLPEDAGPHPRGTPYSAYDPELMLWTIAVAAESSAHFYETLIRRMGARERDRFWLDWVRFGELFGMPRSVAPASWAEFREWFDDRLLSEEMHLTPEARRVGFGVAFRIPMGPAQPLARDTHNLIVLGSLPPVVREHYGLRWSRANEIAYRSAVRTLRTARRVYPRSIARGQNAARFDNVARSEARLIAAGRPPVRVGA